MTFYEFIEFKVNPILPSIEIIATIIGIIFLFINLLKTNKNITLQINASRNSQRPVIKVQNEYGLLPKETQKEECFPVSISINKNDAINFSLEFIENNIVDYSATIKSYDLDAENDHTLFFDRLESGSKIIIRYRINDSAPIPPEKYESRKEMKRIMAYYELNITLRFQDDSGYKYLQNLTINGAFFDKITLHPIKYLR